MEGRDVVGRGWEKLIFFIFFSNRSFDPARLMSALILSLLEL